MYITQDVVDRVKSILKQKNFTLKAMLLDCDLNVNTISEFAKGKQMSCISLAKIADYLDCSVDYLLGRTENPQAHSSNNSISISDVSGNSNNFIGNGATGNVTVNNSFSLTPQESALIKIFRDIDEVKRSKILTYADNLKNDIDILYADNLVPYHYVSNKALLAGKQAVREVDNYLNEKKIYNPVDVILRTCRENISYVLDYTDEEKETDKEAEADFSIYTKLDNLINVFFYYVHGINQENIDQYSNLIKCRNDLAELVGIYKR